MPRLFYAVLVTLSSLCCAFSAAAQNQELPAIPPPPPEMQAFDEAMFEPEVTIVKKEAATHEEYRHQGRLYMVKVTPAVGAPYYLIDNDGNGNFIQQAHQQIKPPRWTLFRW